MFNFLHTYSPDPIAFTLGSVVIHWYGLFLAAGIIAGYALVTRLAPRAGLSSERATTVYINALIWGFVGARLWHVFMEWGFYSQSPSAIIAVWNGGLAIHGALLGGILTLLYYARKTPSNSPFSKGGEQEREREYSSSPLLRGRLGGGLFWKLADLFALPLILGQAIGRWGNYFNQELFGAPTAFPWGIPIDAANRPQEFIQYEFFHPTFLYESLWNLAVFGILFAVFAKKYPSERGGPSFAKASEGKEGSESRRPSEALAKDGVVFWLYVALYSLGRAGTELLRLDAMPVVFGMRLAFVGSVVLVVVGGIIATKLLMTNKGNRFGI